MKWPTGELDSVAILDRQSIHPSQAEPATPYLGLEHLDGDGTINCVKTIDSAGLKSNKFQFSDRHVLFGKLRPYLRKIARPAFSGVCSTDIIPILPKHGVSRDYLFYFLRTPESVNLATSRCTGVNLPRLSPTQLASFRVPLPPLAEQKRIARILDAADALRAKRREALAQLDTLLQSTFLDMFGDPVTNPMGWDSSALGMVGEIITGNTPSRKRPEYYGQGVEWIKSDNINDPSFVLTEAEEHLSDAGKAVARTSPKGSILVTCIAGSPSCIGNVGIADREVAFNQQINAFVPGKRIVLWFAFGLFWVGKRLVQSASTNSMKGMVSKSVFSCISVPIPPISLQNRFATVAESIERQKALQRAHLAELDTLFTSLQSRAFRGDL